jgi:rSAM/selenodomain-associated transferase 2
VRISVVVPALNEAAQIAATLAPLRSWAERGHEVIVVDGGSDDNTAQLAVDAGALVVNSTPGRARQMNAGAARASGNALLFLHADTRIPEQADILMTHALRHRPWGRFNVRIAGRSRWLPVVGAMINLRSRLSGIATGDQGLFMTRAAFDAVGGFPLQPLMEDVEICKRLKRLSQPACLRERAVTSGRRWDTRGAWRTILLMWRLRFDYWRGVPAEKLAERYR